MSWKYSDHTQQRWKRDRLTSRARDVAYEKYVHTTTFAAVWQGKKKEKEKKEPGFDQTSGSN